MFIYNFISDKNNNLTTREFETRTDSHCFRSLSLIVYIPHYELDTSVTVILRNI
jgi:hypothetical protein